MKPLCIDHGCCADGLTAAWVVWPWDGAGQVEFHAATHGKPPPEVGDREVYVVDFSYPRPVIEAMARHATRLTVIDHHLTAAQDLEGVIRNDGVVDGVFDMAKSEQLLAETRVPLPAKAGPLARDDSEYSRHGRRNLLLFCEPWRGYRHVAVTEQRAMQDFARQMKWLVDESYPEADVIRVVLDHLHTQKPAALYETFAPAEARRILRKLAFHDTPKHGRWLNIAEIELRVFSRQCLDRRIGDEEPRKRAIKKLEEERNAASATIEWRVTTEEARQKLHRLYPSTSD